MASIMGRLITVGSAYHRGSTQRHHRDPSPRNLTRATRFTKRVWACHTGSSCALPTGCHHGERPRFRWRAILRRLGCVTELGEAQVDHGSGHVGEADPSAARLVAAEGDPGGALAAGGQGLDRVAPGVDRRVPRRRMAHPLFGRGVSRAAGTWPRPGAASLAGLSAARACGAGPRGARGCR